MGPRDRGHSLAPRDREYSPPVQRPRDWGTGTAWRWSGVPLLDSLDPMAPTLTALERFLERLVERPIGRLFRASIEPEQLRRRVERSMEEGRQAFGGRTFAPDRFRILLEPDDLDGLPAAPPGARGVALRGRPRLRAAARLAARGRPLVTLHPSTAVARGDIVVTATLSDGGRGPLPAGSGPADGRPSLEATAVLPAAALGPVTLIVSSHGRPGPADRARRRRCCASGAPSTTRSSCPTSASRATTA